MDTVRLALSSAGDGMEDANFESQTANNAILRLTKELEWFKTNLKESTRTDMRTVDRVFLLKMRECMKSCREAYEDMKFRDAVKYGFYDLQNVRDDYRNYHGVSHEVMNQNVWKPLFSHKLLRLHPCVLIGQSGYGQRF